jgi:hypothetical protein
VPGNSVAELAAPLRVRLEQLVPADDRLCLGERAIGLCSRSRIFSECELSSRPGEIRRLDPKRDQAAAYTCPNSVDPGAKLPSHPIGDRPIIQRISAQPRS